MVRGGGSSGLSRFATDVQSCRVVSYGIVSCRARVRGKRRRGTGRRGIAGARAHRYTGRTLCSCAPDACACQRHYSATNLSPDRRPVGRAVEERHAPNKIGPSSTNPFGTHTTPQNNRYTKQVRCTVYGVRSVCVYVCHGSKSHRGVARWSANRVSGVSATSICLGLLLLLRF